MIGNFVYNQENEIIEVFSIEKSFVNGIKKIFISPIPLTEEIVKSSKNSLFNNGFEYEFKRGRFHISTSETYVTSIHFVHEFQNLSYEITGCEVELKIK